MKKFSFLSILLFAVYFGFSQTETLPLLGGEWYYSGATQPAVNDTFRMTRNKIHDSYIKWEFRENGSFYEQEITELGSGNNAETPAIIMNSNVPSVWIFNKEEQIIELKDIKRIYRITGVNRNFLDLVRVK